WPGAVSRWRALLRRRPAGAGSAPEGAAHGLEPGHPDHRPPALAPHRAERPLLLRAQLLRPSGQGDADGRTLPLRRGLCCGTGPGQCMRHPVSPGEEPYHRPAVAAELPGLGGALVSGRLSAARDKLALRFISLELAAGRL